MSDLVWIPLALGGPFLYSVTNIIDKHLLGRLGENGVQTLILYSSLLSALALPLIWWIEPKVLEVEKDNIVILCSVAALNVMLLWAYFQALKHDETTVVIIFYQLVPVLGVVLGYLILDEVIGGQQLLGILIIIIGTGIISFDVDEKKSLKWRKRTLVYMLAACLCWALEATIFKLVALDEAVLPSLFWEHLVLAVFGVLIFLLVGKYRRAFMSQVRANSQAVMSINVLNEGLYMLGNAAVSFAVVQAPVALVLLGNSFQSFFAMLLGFALACVYPSLRKGRLTGFQVSQRIVAILITATGSILLLSA